MGSVLSRKQILDQSNCAYNEWCVKWREHAIKHSKLKQPSLEDFRNIGIGKVIVLVANGASLEKHMDIIKENKDNIDIMVCDKSLGHLIKQGIKPKYCIMADAKVSYETYCEPYKDSLKETTLFANACGNPKWAFEADWKNIYFYINKDVIQSEIEFQKLSGCPNIIPAGSNVSNAMVIFVTQSCNEGRQNFFGYDIILLSGFDYSWLPDGNYYAYDKEANGKYYYMNHVSALNQNCDLVYTSHNLAFSAKWLYGYVTTFKLPVVQCSHDSLLPLPWSGPIDKYITYNYHCEDAGTMIKLDKSKGELIKQLNAIVANQKNIERNHALAVARTF